MGDTQKKLLFNIEHSFLKTLGWCISYSMPKNSKLAKPFKYSWNNVAPQMHRKFSSNVTAKYEKLMHWLLGKLKWAKVIQGQKVSFNEMEIGWIMDGSHSLPRATLGLKVMETKLKRYWEARATPAYSDLAGGDS